MADSGRQRKRGGPGERGSKGRGGGKPGKEGAGHDSRQHLIAGLDHRLRRQLLRRLNGSEEPSSPVRLSEQLNSRPSNVSYHMDVLKKCGAVALVDERQVRGAVQHFYVSRVSDDAMVQAMLKETEAEDSGQT